MVTEGCQVLAGEGPKNEIRRDESEKRRLVFAATDMQIDDPPGPPARKYRKYLNPVFAFSVHTCSENDPVLSFS